MKRVDLTLANLLSDFSLPYQGSGCPRLIPADSRYAGIQDAAVCTGCHGPGKEAPLKAKHPPKHECFKCHKAAKV